MPTLSELAKPSLAGWGKYLNTTGHYNEAPDSGAQDFLTRLQAYDPNARIVTETNGDNGQQGYRFDYDISKMPAAEGGDKFQGSMPVISSGAMEVNPGFDRRALFSEDLVHKGDSTYGDWTSGANSSKQVGFDAINTLGPIAIAAITAGAGAGLLPAMMAPEALAGTLGGLQGLSSASGLWGAGGIGGAGAATAGAGNALTNFMNQHGMQLAQKVPGLVNGQRPSASSLASLAGMIPGFGSVAPYLSLAQNAYGASKGNVGAGAQTLAGLYRMFGGGS